jgi:hypothetical protein
MIKIGYSDGSRLLHKTNCASNKDDVYWSKNLGKFAQEPHEGISKKVRSSQGTGEEDAIMAAFKVAHTIRVLMSPSWLPFIMLEGHLEFQDRVVGNTGNPGQL